MRANTRNAIAQANQPRVTMLKYNLRAQAQIEVEKLVKEAEDKAAARMGAQGQRPREGASAGAAGEGVSLDYSKMSNEELYKAIEAASPYN